MSEEPLREENDVLRKAVMALLMREAHIAEILQGVRKCPECQAYFGLVFNESAKPCWAYKHWAEGIDAALELISGKTKRSWPV